VGTTTIVLNHNLENSLFVFTVFFSIAIFHMMLISVLTNIFTQTSSAVSYLITDTYVSTAIADAHEFPTQNISKQYLTKK
jgi:hypothetical protein